MPSKPKTLLKDVYPELAAMLVDDTLRDTVGVQSGKVVDWCCVHGHTWSTRVCSMTQRGRAGECPYCSGKKVWPGFNDIATTHPELVSMLVHPELAKEYSAGSAVEVEWQCEHGHTWSAPINRLTKGHGCPYCAGKRKNSDTTRNPLLKDVNPDLANQLVDQSLAETLTTGSGKKVEWQCADYPDHTWFASTAARVSGKGCPICSGRTVKRGFNDFATLYPELAKTLLNPEDGYTVTGSSAKPLMWVCDVDPSHVWEAMPYNRIRGEGCPVCAGRKVIPGINDLATLCPDIAAELVESEWGTKLTIMSNRYMEWRCANNHNHRWIAAVSTRVHGHGCPYCAAGKHSSKFEEAVLDAVQLLMPQAKIVTNDRSLIRPKELDIYIPEAGIAIECNGVYWHSADIGRHIDAMYHLDKFKACRDTGVQLIQIYDDDWTTKESIVIRMLANKLHASANLEYFDWFESGMADTVGARLCVCECISSSVAGEFLTKNHIQGKVTATYHFGLRDKSGCLRAVLSIRSPEANSRAHRQLGEWEIQRYATYGHVPGGFTKLMHYASEYIWDMGYELYSWVSFSSNDVSDGAMYRNCGFIAVNQIAPNYMYVGTVTDNIRKPKEGFQKSKFKNNPRLKYEDGLTERELASLNKLYRVYDAGKTKWVKSLEDEL